MELFKLLGTIAIEGADKANKDINEVTGVAEKAGSKLGGAVSKIGGAVVKAGAVVGAGVAAAATGISALTKQAVGSYAEYEQLVGGVETLFKDSQSKVIEYANNAYKTAGLSANEYMETVTSFSASLLQSLDGDTAKAAEKANTAIVDMSDNANKMGTSMESIQNAYQGFAKQNYTMLDNLKLGYGGTKQEMERLLEDAEKLSGQKFDISSYADIVDAIHVVQTELGITGTTSKEAASTISGSIGMMKSAWQNLMVGMADPNQDFGALINNLVDSVVTAANNIAPRIIETLPRIVEGLTSLIENLIPYIQPVIKKLLPPLLDGAVKLVVYLVQNLPSLIKTLGTALWNALKQMFTEIGGMLPEEANGIFSTISQAFADLWEVCMTVWNTYGKPIWDMISFAVGEIVAIFQENMPAIKKFFDDALSGIKDTWNNHLKPVFDAIADVLNNKIKPAFEFVFKTIIEPLVTTVFQSIARLWTGTLKPIFDGICDFLTGVFSGDWKKAFQGILNITIGIFNGIRNAIETPMDAVKNIVNSAIEFIKEKFNFKWELPKLKLPHFKINGEFSLNPPSVPSFGVDWYKKAMDEPMIMNSPTAFGINKNGQIMAGGEAGSEVVSGTDTLMNMISEAVSAKNQRLEEILQSILSYMPQMANMQVVMDTGATVGALVAPMDKELGRRAARSGRGV